MTKLVAVQGGAYAEVDIPVPNAGRVLVDFAGGKTIVSVSVSAPGVVASSVISAQVSAIATTDHSADEHVVEEIEVRAGPPVPGAGFTVFARTRNVKLFGKYTVSWVWS